jgi:hypothetical protein
MKTLKDLKKGDVVKMANGEQRVVLFARANIRTGYCFVKMSGQNTDWSIQNNEIIHSDMDSFVYISENASLNVVGNVF